MSNSYDLRLKKVIVKWIDDSLWPPFSIYGAHFDAFQILNVLLEVPKKKYNLFSKKHKFKLNDCGVFGICDRWAMITRLNNLNLGAQCK